MRYRAWRAGAVAAVTAACTRAPSSGATEATGTLTGSGAVTVAGSHARIATWLPSIGATVVVDSAGAMAAQRLNAPSSTAAPSTSAAATLTSTHWLTAHRGGHRVTRPSHRRRPRLTVVDSAGKHVVPEHHSLRSRRRRDGRRRAAVSNPPSLLGVACSNAASAAGAGQHGDRREASPRRRGRQQSAAYGEGDTVLPWPWTNAASSGASCSGPSCLRRQLLATASASLSIVARIASAAAGEAGRCPGSSRTAGRAAPPSSPDARRSDTGVVRDEIVTEVDGLGRRIVERRGFVQRLASDRLEVELTVQQPERSPCRGGLGTGTDRDRQGGRRSRQPARETSTAAVNSRPRVAATSSASGLSSAGHFAA